MTKIAILGSGISSLYCISNILRRIEKVRVDIFEAQSYAYGLLNSGVSPKSAEFKLLAPKFDKILQDPRVNIFLSQEKGKDDPRLKFYDYVIDASGGLEKRHPSLDYGQGTYYSAIDFTCWYNGRCPLLGVEKIAAGNLVVAIIGYGNVSLDLVDYFLTPLKFLQHYSFSDQALKFKQCRSFDVIVVGRKSIDNSAFTTSEFKSCLSSKSFSIENDTGSLTGKGRFAHKFQRAKMASQLHFISNCPNYEIDKKNKIIILSEEGYKKELKFDLLITSFGFESKAKENQYALGWAKTGRGTIALSSTDAKQLSNSLIERNSDDQIPYSFGTMSSKDSWLAHSLCERTCGNLDQKQLLPLGAKEVNEYLLKTSYWI